MFTTHTHRHKTNSMIAPIRGSRETDLQCSQTGSVWLSLLTVAPTTTSANAGTQHAGAAAAAAANVYVNGATTTTLVRVSAVVVRSDGPHFACVSVCTRGVFCFAFFHRYTRFIWEAVGFSSCFFFVVCGESGAKKHTRIHTQLIHTHTHTLNSSTGKMGQQKK